MTQRSGAVAGGRDADADAETTGHDIIVIGTSAGGVEALARIAHGLPEDLPAAICIVIHTTPQSPSMMPQILSRNGPLPAKHPVDGEPIELGHIYVAPPDQHVLIERGRLRAVRGPKENHARPAVDPLFRSAALAYGPRVVGVVLTGALDDGTAGLLAIKRRGGLAVVQDPRDAQMPSMPESALAYVQVDYVVPLARMADLLTRLAQESIGDVPDGETPVAELLRYEANMAEMEESTVASGETPGAISALTCPECGGPIYELYDSTLVRFRCRSGHAYSAEGMASQQAESTESALWEAVNALMESAQLSERMARDAHLRRHDGVAERFEERMRESIRRAELIRGVLRTGDSTQPTGAATSELEAPLT